MKKITELSLTRRKNSLENNEGEDHSIPIAIHYSSKGIIVIIFAGANSSLDGYQDKYLKTANLIQEKIGAVIRVANVNDFSVASYFESAKDDLTTIINYAIKNSKKICGQKNPDIYLYGFSLGATTCATLSSHFSQIKKVLLVSASGIDEMGDVIAGLSKFSGKLHLVVGDLDRFKGAGLTGATVLFHIAKKVRTKDIRVIHNCDHRFAENLDTFIELPVKIFTGTNNLYNTITP